MKVEINKRETDVAPGIKTLEALLTAENLTGPGRAVAVDNRVVSRSDRENMPLKEGMKITVIKAVCGG